MDDASLKARSDGLNFEGLHDACHRSGDSSSKRPKEGWFKIEGHVSKEFKRNTSRKCRLTGGVYKFGTSFIHCSCSCCLCAREGVSDDKQQSPLHFFFSAAEVEFYILPFLSKRYGIYTDTVLMVGLFGHVRYHLNR